MKTKLLTLFFSIALFSACQRDHDLGDTLAHDELRAFPSAVGYTSDESLNEFSSITPTTSQSAPPSAPYESNNSRKLIRHGSIKFATDDLEQTIQSIKTATNASGGYIGSENTTNDNYLTSTLMTVRIPSVQFDSFLTAVSKDVKKFEERDISSKDVTEEFVDLNARISTKKKVEQRYLEILKSAKTVKEILEVEAEIGAVREEIERAEGRLKYLQNQTSMSTFFIEFYKTLDADTAEGEGTFISDIKASLSIGLGILSQLFLGLISIWPLLLIAVSGYFIYRSSRKTAKT